MNQQTAVPPVRIRELTAAYGERPMSSVCADDYTAAIDGLVSRIVDAAG